MKKGEKGDLTKFSKSFCQTVVAYGVADEDIIRNRDIMIDRKKGLSYSQLSIKYSMRRATVIDICKSIK